MFSEPFSRHIDDYPEGIILPVDKPYRWTSADVVRKLKWAACRHFGKRNLKVGHAGTLDPLATGILLVCIGKEATRRAEELQRSPKSYVAGVTFGATTPSFDLEKDIDSFYPSDNVTEAALKSVIPSFIGEQDQVAPLFSAKSVDGVRAYETARRMLKEARRTGEPFDPGDILHSSRITVYGMELLSFDSAPVYDAPVPVPGSRINVADISGLHLPSASIRIDCSKGTYIRAIARDLGEALGTGAFLNSLRRIRNGGYDIDDAISLETALSLLSSPSRESL